MPELGIVSGTGKSALVGVKLMYAASAFRRKVFVRADPTENTRPAQSIVSHSPVPRSLSFKTFNARVINGSMPFSISVFLLSSLMTKS